MKKFTFVLAATALCVNVGFAQTLRSLNCPENFNQVKIRKVDNTLMKKTLPGTPVEKFDFVKENIRHMARKPAQVAELTAPVALPATDVSDAAFVANWNAVSEANYYEVDVYRTFTTTVDVDFYALYEDFYFVEASDEEYTYYLDDYTYRSQWILIGGKLGDQSIIFPLTSSQNATELDTPPLDLSAGGSTGTVYFGINMEGNVNDKVSLGYYYEDENGEEQAGGLGSLTFTESTMSGVYEITNLPLSAASGFFIYTDPSLENTGEIKLNAFTVLQPLAAGTQFTGFHDYRTTQGTSAPVFTMEKDTETEGVTDEFMYGVFALDVDMTTGSIVDASSISNIIMVNGTSGVEGVQASNDKIFVHDNLHVVLEKPATIAVYNMAGVLVMSVEGVEGENEIALPAAGAYIVKAGNTVAKVMK